MVLRIAAAAGLLAAAGCCTPVNPFVCGSSAACLSAAGQTGTCEATGFCSFADAACPSGRRYGGNAGGGLGGACVPPTSPGCMPPDCSDGNPCSDDTCDPTMGCLHANNAAPCDDGLFCNGTDSCGAGTCSVHSGGPCPASCNEATHSCPSCGTNADCGSPSAGPWGACAGFPDACALGGTQSRDVSTPTCASSACTTVTTTETQSCTRPSTDWMPCGSVGYDPWGACAFADPCVESGSQTRAVHTPTCSGGACADVTTAETQSCTRSSTDGTVCRTGGTIASCGGVSLDCFRCGGGTCNFNAGNYDDPATCNPSCGTAAFLCDPSRTPMCCPTTATCPNGEVAPGTYDCGRCCWEICN